MTCRLFALSTPRPQAKSDVLGGVELTVATFDKELPVATLLKLLDGSAFEHCLPVASEVAEYSELFREMLPKGYVKLNEDTEEVCFCHRRGWVYSSQDPLDPVVTRYTFPSPLHRASVSWRRQPSPRLIPSMLCLSPPFPSSSLPDYEPRFAGSVHRTSSRGTIPTGVLSLCP